MGDADFEFSSAGSRPMMAADQLFSKGRILPLREAPGSGRPVTLRDELRAHEVAIADRHRRVAHWPAGTSARWKEMLGLKRGHRKQAAVESAEESASTHDPDHMNLGGGE
ncbi:hypothetical protein E2562_026340 [Oryza meyeriana var. granulata]|uniref:Uncharacterized protein n=1 Tax=Oryza meyeriana var. granulata TaxID=110450 RepID=A0A6G1D8C4_9ORYZ|nr:hypothetical protein E2562_026340 [Oryza meyeriana var. granulata]